MQRTRGPSNERRNRVRCFIKRLERWNGKWAGTHHNQAHAELPVSGTESFEFRQTAGDFSVVGDFAALSTSGKIDFEFLDDIFHIQAAR